MSELFLECPSDISGQFGFTGQTWPML